MNRSQKISRDLLIAYALLMLWLLFGQRIGSGLWEAYPQRLAENFNLVPLSTLVDFADTLRDGMNPALVRHAIINLAGNVVMFVPLGALLPGCFAWLRSFGRCMAVSAGILCAVELIQLFTLLGVCDVDDLILNLLGTATGFLLYAGMGKLRRGA